MTTRPRSPLCVFVVCGLLLACHSAHASSLIYESSTGNSYQLPGFSVGDEAFLGSRFTLTQAFDVDAIGGAFSINNPAGDEIFGAIIQMQGLLPQGTATTPFNNTEVLASVTFSASNTGDTIVPLPITLAAGDYAVVFGSGLFGATASNAMDDDGVSTVQGLDSFFYRSGDNWFNGATDKTRFLVFGEAVPEPGSLAVLGMGALLAGRRRRP